MQLNITRINNNDLAMYFCIAKNARGITKGAFTLYGNQLDFAFNSVKKNIF